MSYTMPTGFQGFHLNSFGTSWNIDKKLKGEVPTAIKGFTDPRWTKDTYFSHYADPFTFMKAMVQEKQKLQHIVDNEEDYPELSSYDITHKKQAIEMIEDGEERYKKIDELNGNYKDLYDSASKEIREKLQARGLITKYLAGNVEMTNIPTGVLSHSQVALGRPDCWIKTLGVGSGKIFYDLYINLSYSGGYADSEITKNAYAVYALVQALVKIIPMRIYVVNHVGTNTPICYSYCLKEYGRPINPKQFLFFLTHSKRTFGWASYEILDSGASATVGRPTGTLNLAGLNLNNIIDDIINKIATVSPWMIKKIKKN